MASKLLIRAAAAVALTWTGGAQAAVTLYGLTRADSGRNLVSFFSETPGTFASNIAITGAVDRSVDLFSLDLNTSNNTLYAVGSLGGGQYALFRIGYDGVATRVGTNLGVNIGSENAGLDYDAAANVFRIVTNRDDVFLIDPATGLASAGQSFDYAPGDPLGGANPNILAAAYGGRFYVLDKNGPGNAGLLATLSGTTLNSVAALDRAIDTNSSFDIAFNGEAYFHDGFVQDRLFLLNLSNGVTTDKGALQLQLTGLTAGPGAIPEPATWATMILGFGAIGGALRRRRRTRPAHA